MLSLERPGVSSCSSEEKPGAIRTRVAPANPATSINTRKRRSASDSERNIRLPPLHRKRSRRGLPENPCDDDVPASAHTCDGRLLQGAVPDPCCRQTKKQNQH